MKRALVALLFIGALGVQAQSDVTLTAGDLQMQIASSAPLRYGFSVAGKQVLGADTEAGIRLAGMAASAKRDGACGGATCKLALSTASGGTAKLEIELEPHHAHLVLRLAHPGVRVEFLTAGAAPGYGLADHVFLNSRYNTDVTGISDDHFLSGPESSRLTSNFAIYPEQGVAVLVVDPTRKIVRSSADEIVQGVEEASTTVDMHYFFGDPHAIYAEFLKVRNAAGYPVLQPKYAMFGLGWEAFGALGWESNQKTVQESIDRYRSLGYPLSWIVIGSGHWPEGERFRETTSFGMFDPVKYPDPKKLFAHFHDENLKVLLGLRIDFLVDGPFSAEGIKGHYFLEKEGWPIVYRGGWPKSPYYLLNAQDPKALNWYMGLVTKWTDFGVDGFKEDYFEFGKYTLRDDKLDPVSNRFMEKGIYLIERNGYLSSNGDIQRINDFNFNQNQDRGPVNALAFAYSGFPLVYPDIVGGTFGENLFSLKRTPKMETYFMRNAQWAALHSSMSVGEPPWSFANPKVGQVMLQAAKLHERLRPYIYSQALRFVKDGYPWTMTPLPVAYPEDKNVHGRENAMTRGYEWMIGDALLATPLYGEDYNTAVSRDVYLPAGEWMEYDSGAVHQGPAMLKAYPLPIGKTPLFVGGSGVVIEQAETGLVARVYPVTKSAKVEFTYPDAKATSSFDVKVADWKAVHVDAGGRPVAGRWVRHAYEFPIVPGENYLVR